MWIWQREKLPAIASVFYPGALPPRLENIAAFDRGEFGVKRLPSEDRALWAVSIEHPSWGRAQAMVMRDLPPVPPEILDFTGDLTPAEKEILRDSSSIGVRLESTREEAPLARKRLLRFCSAISGSGGLAVADHVSEKLWSRRELEDELRHDAELDIEQMMSVHCVAIEDGGPVRWLHTHGLAQMGGFDFDILDPAELVYGRGSDLLRGLAFAIAEGKVRPSEPEFLLALPGGLIRLAPAAEFDRGACREARGIRDSNDHTESRSVVCEPGSGWLDRLWPRSLEPSRFLRNPPEQLMVMFTEAATELMTRRARETYDVLRQLAEEFRTLELPVIAKLAFPRDNGDGREHMWFEVHEMGDSFIDATLDNDPYHVTGLARGDRGRHPVDSLSDWRILTPFGYVTPRSMAAARLLREHCQ